MFPPPQGLFKRRLLRISSKFQRCSEVMWKHLAAALSYKCLKFKSDMVSETNIK
uniref:Uncharacterized protein n=1 Tax=Anguilla anguilla TaxID=7936 RepID=A0A0E9WYL6_ANGAN